MDDQDWTPVVVRRRGKPSTGTSASKRVSVETTRAINAAQTSAAIERRADEGDLKRKKVTVESRQALVQARLKLNITQTEADAQCNIPKNTINRIESGSIVPDGLTMSKIRRTLGVDIRLS